MHHAGGDGRRQLDAEIAVGHAVHAVGAGGVKAQLFGGESPVQRVGGAGQGARAQGALAVHPAGGVHKAAKVPQQHPGVGHQGVAEGDGLGPLQVGVARHHRGGVFPGLFADDPDQVRDQPLQADALVPQGEPDVQGDLVVAAAAGVQPLAGVADAGGEGLLHKGVHVLGGGIDLQRAGSQVVRDGGQPAEDGLAVGLRDDALPGQHGGVDAAALHILGDHPLVETDGGVEIIHAGIHRFGKAALPELFSHDRLLSKNEGLVSEPRVLRPVKRQSRRKKRVLRRCRRPCGRLLLTSARKV